MRIAFIILAHRDPEQVQRLVQRLQHPYVDCYVHLDAKCDISQWAHIARPQVYFIEERLSLNWAGFNITQATLNAIAAILSSGRPYSYLSLISGQDYPLRKIDELYDHLRTNEGLEFLEVWPSSELAKNITKVTQYHFEDLRLPGKYRLTKWLNRIVAPRRHPLNMEVYMGSQWWSLTRDCAAYCLQFTQEQPKLKRFYKYVWGSDEFFFHVVIMNSPFKDRVADSNLRYIDWSDGKASPKTFTLSDLPALMKSSKFLARKFDMAQEPELLDRIDDRLNGD